MTRAILIAAIFIAGARTSAATVQTYPPLTRESLTGIWEGLFNFDTTYTILHIAIASEDTDSYLVEITAGQRGGGMFRLASCTVDAGKIELVFRAKDGSEWWIIGEGGAGENEGIIRANFGTGFNPHRAGPPYSLCFGKGAWTRDIGKASTMAEEIVAQARRDAK